MRYAKSAILSVFMLAIALQSIGDTPVLQSTNGYRDCGTSRIISTTNQTAVMEYWYVYGQDGEAYGWINWGDGTTGNGGCLHRPGDNICCFAFYSHVYDCPGTYTITAYGWVDFLPNPVVCGGGTVAIQPLGGFLLVATSDGNNEVVVETADVINRSKISESTVDWGDETPVEPFTWVACSDSTLCLPPHTYTNLGDFDIVVVNRYGGACPFERSDSLRISVDAVNPVEHRTWGAIKAIYRQTPAEF
jgi:hypothetical protein